MTIQKRVEKLENGGNKGTMMIVHENLHGGPSACDVPWAHVQFESGIEIRQKADESRKDFEHRCTESWIGEYGIRPTIIHSVASFGENLKGL
ncbi:hypothetical protein [uncultured Litoreibacter sp.]|uniref:hypothetical protein n=1 Tax=uncultured Litoreibacter sp. TaxID=1392394 RepID=UPI00262D5340|nr:hypothetical protein [uncultured Litoreibacter sp.]